MEEKKSRIFFAVAAFAIPVVLYSYVSFHVFPASHFLKYSLAAEKISNHTLGGDRLLDYSPLYLMVHVVLRNEPVIQWIQIFLAGGASCLLFLLLSRFFRRSIAIAGTIAFILNRTLMVYTTVPEPEVFLLFWIIASLFFLYGETKASHFVAGIFFTLGILTRPNFLPVLAVVLLYFFIQQKDRKAAFVSAVLFFLPVCIGLTAIWVRNARILGHFSPIVMNPGTIFFEGNNPLSHGQDVVYPALVGEIGLAATNESDYQHEIYRVFARNATGKNLSILEVNSYWIHRATDFLKDYPGHTIRLFATKLFHCFHGYEWHDLSNAYWNERMLQKMRFPAVPFALVSTLAILGMLVKARETRKWILLYAVLFCQVAVMVAIYVHARHRLAILAVFILFACAGLEYLLICRRKILIVAALIPLLVFLSWPTDLMREETHLWTSLQTASLLRTKAFQLRGEGKWNEAADAAALALAYAPWQYDQGRPANLPYAEDFVTRALQISKPPQTFSERFDHATLLLLAGRLKESQAAFLDILQEGYEFKRDQFESSQPLFYLARIAEMQNNPEEALLLLKQGLEKSPGEPYLLSHLFVLTREGAYREKLFRYFGDIDAQFYLGQANLQVGDPAEALQNFEYVNEKIPGFRRGLFFDAAALGKTGRLQEGATVYRKAISIQPDPVLMEKESLELFQRLSQDSNDAFALFSYGIVLRQFGHYKDALSVQQKARLIAPQNQQISSEIDTIERISGTISR